MRIKTKLKKNGKLRVHLQGEKDYRSKSYTMGALRRKFLFVRAPSHKRYMPRYVASTVVVKPTKISAFRRADPVLRSVRVASSGIVFAESIQKARKKILT